MQFSTRKRRQAPAIIIVSLIDVLIVVLIFLIVSTTFKNQPAMKLALPQSAQAKEGAAANPKLVVSIPKEGKPLLLGDQALTLDRLQEKLTELAVGNPDTILAIRADTDAPFGVIVQVMDAAKAAKIKSVSAFTKTAAK